MRWMTSGGSRPETLAAPVRTTADPEAEADPVEPPRIATSFGVQTLPGAQTSAAAATAVAMATGASSFAAALAGADAAAEALSAVRFSDSPHDAHATSRRKRTV